LTRGGPYEEVLRNQDIPVTVLNKRWKFDFRTYAQLKQLVADFQPDIVHTWLFAANTVGRLVAGAAGQPKVIVSERCVDSWKGGWQRWIDRRLVSRTSCLVGNSQSVAEYYRELGFPPERTRVIPNAIEPPAIHEMDRKAFLQEFNLPESAHIVSYVGRLAKQKRIKDLIWTIELLQQLDANTHFLILGDGPEKESLQQFARQIHCDSRIHFLGHRNDVSQLMPYFDAFWLASDFEGMSNSLMEAMANGVPAVVSDIPANRELVIDGETGFLVSVGDTAGFAQFTDRIFADKQLASHLGKASRNRMSEEFNIDKMVDSYAELYRDTLDEPVR
jgi:glycosyltransferase involved in cell wall biosynthesis